LFWSKKFPKSGNTIPIFGKITNKRQKEKRMTGEGHPFGFEEYQSLALVSDTDFV